MNRSKALSGSMPESLKDVELRSRRMLQVSLVTIAGLLLISVVADERIMAPLCGGLVMLFLVAGFAWRRKPGIAANLFLWSLTLMLSALAWISEGVRDMALLAYPGVLIFSSILGGRSLFFPLLIFMLLFATVTGLVTLAGWHKAFYYDLAYRHIIFVDVILLMTGFSAYILLLDQRRLINSLDAENRRVRENENLIGALANADQLTGLANRRYLEAEFDKQYQTCTDTGSCLAVLFFDLDNFKPVNDSLGHAAGDALLRKMAERMNKLIAAEDILCRFGGDEFLVLTRFQPGEEKRIGLFAQSLIDTATQPFFINETRIEVSGSVGVAYAPQHGNSFNELCKHADLAMYQAKADGRHIYRVYDESMKRDSKEKLELMVKMRDALKNNEFSVYFQPQINVASCKVQGAEALIRWLQADGSFVSPAEFIPLAERTGLIVDIGFWVLQQSCLACAEWQRLGYSPMTVSVNLSYAQFRDGDLPGKVQQLLTASGIPASNLELELTESMLIGESPNVQRQMDELHQLGVTFAIDDFGTGYSNLGYLKRFNATRLKIDKSFVSELGSSSRNRPLVTAIIQMSESLDISVVAEGVEDQQTFKQLSLLGCHQAQGYLWSPALNNEDFIRWLENYRPESADDFTDSAQL